MGLIMVTAPDVEDNGDGFGVDKEESRVSDLTLLLIALSIIGAAVLAFWVVIASLFTFTP